MIRKKILKIIILFLLTISNSISIENKILLKVDNEIITTVDVLNESNYIKAMNKGLENISDEDLWKISINSIKNEKIRKVELLNHIDEIEVQDENINIIMKSIYQKMGFKKLEEFKDYLQINNVDLKLLTY